MTLLQYFIKCKHPTNPNEQITLAEYTHWLEGLCYQLIKERQELRTEALEAASNINKDTLIPEGFTVDDLKGNVIPFPGKADPYKLYFLCKDCAAKHPGEDKSIGALTPRSCDLCGKTVLPTEEYEFQEQRWIKNDLPEPKSD